MFYSLNNRYKIKIIQVYTPTLAYDDEDVEKQYEDVEAALELQYSTQYTLIIGDLNVKVGNKSVGMTVSGTFVIYTVNDKGDMLVGFTERNNIKIINTFFYVW